MKHMHVTAAYAKLLVRKEKLEKELMMLVAQIERETEQMEQFMQDELACETFAEFLGDVEEASSSGLNLCYVLLPNITEFDEVRIAIFKALLEERRFMVEPCFPVFDKPTSGGELAPSTKCQLNVTW